MAALEETGADHEFSISVEVPLSTPPAPAASPSPLLSTPTLETRAAQRPKLAIINMNDAIKMSTLHKSRSALDKEEAENYAKHAPSLNLNLNLTPLNSKSKGTRYESPFVADRGAESTPASPAGFPGRRSAYIQHYRHAWDLQLTKSLLRERGGPPGPRSPPNTYRDRPIRRAQSAPVVLNKSQSPEIDVYQSQTISTINISGDSIQFLDNDKLQNMKRATTAASTTPQQFMKPRKLGAVRAMEGYTSYPKSYSKMMEIVKNLRDQRSPLTAPSCSGGSLGPGSVVDLQVRGSSPGKRKEPVEAWSPGGRNNETATTKHTTTPVPSTDSLSEDGRVTTPIGVHISNGLNSPKGLEAETDTKLILNRDELDDGESCRASDYDRGASQLLNYYIARENVEDYVHAHGKHMGQNRHALSHKVHGTPPLEQRLSVTIPTSGTQTPGRKTTPRATPTPNDSAISVSKPAPRSGRYYMGKPLRSSPSAKYQTTTETPDKNFNNFVKFNQPVYLHKRASSAPIIKSPADTTLAGNQNLQTNRSARNKIPGCLAQPTEYGNGKLHSNAVDGDGGFMIVGRSMDVENGKDGRTVNNECCSPQGSKTNITIDMSYGDAQS